jgi:CBS-domain-containing membrane protein
MDKTPSLITSPEDEFSDVVRRFAEQPELRGIFIADEECHLLGVITRRDLLDWARVQLGAAFYAEKEDWLKEDVRLFELMRASNPQEIARPDSAEAAAKLDDPLSEALRKMIVLDLICLPVVDDQGIIIGDLKFTEILFQALHSIEE